jgi:hypothetical protein
MAGFGFTGVASAQTITNTGPGSRNTISTTTTNNCRVTNTNNVSVVNRNHQYAATGDATESGNTSAGLPWTGWAALDPAAAQANGTSYSSWMNGITNWISQRASGDGWNSNQTNLSWTPASADWSGFDPVTWQASGQSFGNWYNSVETYLNSNSSNWLLTWPPDATGSGSFSGATTGNATNNNNANFSININNAARAAAGTNACGQSNFTPPPATGGMGGGGGQVMSAHTSFTPRSGGSGGAGGLFGSSAFRTPAFHAASAPAVVHNTPAPVAQTPPVAPPVTPTAPSSSISNTGPGSTNTISSTTSSNTTVTNDNNICVTNVSSQSASTGSSSVSGNTSTGGGGSGDASNANGTSAGVGINS